MICTTIASNMLIFSNLGVDLFQPVLRHVSVVTLHRVCWGRGWITVTYFPSLLPLHSTSHPKCLTSADSRDLSLCDFALTVLTFSAQYYPSLHYLCCHSFDLTLYFSCIQVRDIDYDHLETLYEVLGRILVKPEVSDSHNKNNAGYSILFEAISLIISFGNDAPEYLRDQGIYSTTLDSILLCLLSSNLPLICSILFRDLEFNFIVLEPYPFLRRTYN